MAAAMTWSAPEGDGGDVGRFLVDDEFFNHPKAVAVGPLGRDLFLAGVAYCNRLFTDGYIPAAVAPTLSPGMSGSRKVIGTLLEVGLWEEVARGFQVHDFLDWNPPAARRKAERDAAKERKKAWIERKRNAVPNASGTPFGTQKEREKNAHSSSSGSCSTENLKIKPLARIRALETEFAECFWSLYPLKVKKPRAFRAWRALAPDADTCATIRADVERRKVSPEWLKNGGEFIPHPASYLNDRRWEDQPGAPQAPLNRATQEKFRGLIVDPRPPK